MENTELKIAGITISKSVVSTVVKLAAERVEGVVSVGGNDIASNLVSVFTRHNVSPEKSVDSFVEDNKLHLGVHLAVFYGYPFVKLADAGRNWNLKLLRKCFIFKVIWRKAEFIFITGKGSIIKQFLTFIITVNVPLTCNFKNLVRYFNKVLLLEEL